MSPKPFPYRSKRTIWSSRPDRALLRGDVARDEPIFRTRQANVSAQGAAFVLCAEQAATLQLRNHQFAEFIDAGREHLRHDVEAVSRAAAVPLLQRVGDVGGGAERDAMAARGGHALVELPDSQILAPRHLHHHLLAALLGV